MTKAFTRSIAIAGVALMFAGRAPDLSRVPAEPAQPAVFPGFLERYAATRGFSLGQPRSVQLTPDADAVLFLRSGPRSFVQDLYSFDLASAKERVLITVDKILGSAEEHLTREELARRERSRTSTKGIVSYQMSEDGKNILAPLSGRLFVIDRASGAVKELVGAPGFPIDPQFSRDGSKVACVREGDLYVLDVASGAETRVTRGATTTVTHGLAEFVAQEEMGRFHGTWWSPDGATIAYQETDTAGLETFFIADPMNPDKEPSSWPYPRPGKKNADVKLGVISAAGGETTWVQWDRQAYPYLADVTWEPNSPLAILVENREQTHELLLAVDPATGKTTTLLEEHDDAWLNLHESMPRWLPDGSGFLWLSERSGESQLELRERDGGWIRAVTPAGFGLRRLVDVDEAKGEVIVAASTEPTQSHLWRLPLDPTKGSPTALTTEPGLHGAIFAKRHGAFVQTSTTLHGEIQSIVRRADGSRAGELASTAERPPMDANLEITTAPGPDGFRAAIVRPRDFDGAKRYPVLVSVYGGPGSQTVTAARRAYLLDQWYADHGFIVVSIDGHGTPGRGRAWERATKNNFIDIPLSDQVTALRSLGAKYKEMDLTRVGIWGWSFGGYFSAMAVMRRPDVFRVGVAGAPVADFADYDTHYTERFLGLPEKNAEGYRACSVLTYCKDLERPLLIIHGTADDNVYFMHSLKMTDALFRAGKSFEFLPLCNFTHMVPDPLVTSRLQSRILEFLEKGTATY